MTSKLAHQVRREPKECRTTFPKMTTTLATRPTEELAPPVSQPVPVGQMLQAVIDKGMTAENVGVVEKLIELHERMEARDAEKAFAAAFVKLQADLGPVQAMRTVPGNNGGVRYTFAEFGDIMRQAKPVLQANGFTVTFSMEVGEGRITQHCTLQHVGGHKRVNSFTARIGKGPPGSTETQADGAASTYAKRFALCDALAITVERDGDARSEGSGERISPEQADELRERLRAVLGDEEKFLTTAGVTTYEEIPVAKFDILDAMLRAKEDAAKRRAKA